MSFLRRPFHWLCLPAFAATFWITFRVMSATAPATVSPERMVVEHAVTPDGSPEVKDPALEAMLARWARASSTGIASVTK